MTKTLLLVTRSFPPVNNIAAQRFPSMLPVLKANGWQVWVLTQNATGTMSVPLPEERIIRIQRHFQEDLRISSDSQFVRGSRLRAAARRVFNASGLTMHTMESSLLTWGWPVLRQLSAIQARLPHVDVVLGSYGPCAALWLARRLAAVYRAPWVADFRDLAALRPVDRGWHAQWLDRRLEAWLLKDAAALTVCGHQWAEMLGRYHNRTPQVIYNGWDWPELAADGAPDAGAAGALADKRPYLYYAGRFYERQLEAVSCLVQAIAGTPFQLVIRSLGPKEREDKIVTFARQIGVLDRMHLLPPVPHSAVLPEAQGAAANLVLETLSTEETWMSGHLSGKFLQLLPLRPPIIYVARADAEAGPILQRTGKGRLCSSVEDIRTQLRRLQNGEPGSVNRAAIDEFSKARQAERLLEVIETARAGSRLPEAAHAPYATTQLRSDT